MSVYRRQLFYPHIVGFMCEYIRRKSSRLKQFWLQYISIADTIFLSTHSWIHCFSISDTTFLPHLILFKIFHYVTDISFVLKHFWTHCICVSEKTILSSSTVGYIVSVYHRKSFIPTHCSLKWISISDTKI